MRRPVIAGNWKMHKTSHEAQEFIEKLAANLKGVEEADVIVAPAFTSLEAAVKAAQGSQIKIAAQNMHWENKGAYTGEISPAMLRDLGVTHCIIGHSERRQYFAETDHTVNKKVRAALDNEIIPIVCVGEILEEREKGDTFNVVEKQTKAALEGLTSTQVAELILAYEPVWAIGTGKTSSADDAQEVITKIREIIANDFGRESAGRVRIQYGGSVKPENIKGFMEQSDIDGALVGGASLEVDSFLKLINY
ncbi:triose-phosphate isomerase [Desulfitibacter alkalitolerans]|uniref:triose-phosphate isomerase n=1 Tax=Desulfitibacter alkalitolerans TaxID=264641 RepID=UPI000487F2E3|nr:triose-phosphate isomerase [Desulfitibacter alkalitolerans]